MDDGSHLAKPPLQTLEEVQRWLHPLKLEDITECEQAKPPLTPKGDIGKTPPPSVTHYIRVSRPNIDNSVAVTATVYEEIKKLRQG